MKGISIYIFVYLGISGVTDYCFDRQRSTLFMTAQN